MFTSIHCGRASDRVDTADRSLAGSARADWFSLSLACTLDA